MFISYENTKLFVRVIGKKQNPIVLFLHGWGCDGTVFLPLVAFLEKQYCCVMVDFPPFGKSGLPNKVWTLDDYVNAVKQVTENLGLEKICVIGHSFGGRVAIRLASCYNKVNKLVLVGAAGLPPRRSVSYYAKVCFFKLFKKHLNQNKYGSADYKKLSPLMKKTFVFIVNTNQTEECKNIGLPTLIVFGENDRETPLAMGKVFAKLIKNSTLKVMKNAGHYCFLDQEELFFDYLTNFLKGDL